MRICLGISGSIAAYRSPDLVKELVKRGHTVRTVLTRSANELVSARVLETFSGQPVMTHDTFDATHSGTDHISIARWAECIAVYGATANFIARYAAGMADDFLCLQLMAAQCPVVLAPAMNPSMWKHPAVRHNTQLLGQRGARFVDPIHGQVACGETGQGHIAELADIVRAIEATASPKASATSTDAFLSGKKVLISAGPMRTAIDSVRYVQNRSSGLMGLEVARAARTAGATVHVLLGPVGPEMAMKFSDFSVTRYVGADDYGQALERLLPEYDSFLSLAAVLDFQFVSRKDKIDRRELAKMKEMSMPIEQVTDYVARTARDKRPGQKIIAFAAESGEKDQILERAYKKMIEKGVDALVANPVWPELGPEAQDNEMWVLTPGGQPLHLPRAPKNALATPLLRALFS